MAILHGEATEKRIWRLIVMLDGKMRLTGNKSRAVPVLYNRDYDAEFSFCGNNNWILTSPIHGHKVHNPSIDYLLEKYVRLEHANFNRMVGNYVLYDAEGEYIEATRNYIKSNRQIFIEGFIERLEKAIERLS